MDRHTRMARTLGCLVASMTAGAAVLDWIQPDRSGLPGRSIDLIASANTVTQQCSIRIDPYKEDSAKLGEAHFFVDRLGQCRPTPSWNNRKQQLSVVRIGLESAADSNILTPSQEAATRSLVLALQKRYNIKASPSWNDTIALPPAPSPQAARPTPSSGQLRR